jgi:thioesterase domain-containing protein
MVPGDFIFLKEIPMLPNGKVDKKSLPKPESVRTIKNNNYVEPQNSLELQLVKIWEKVLGVKPVGIRDNFFDLGGHSLFALRVFGYIEKLTGKKLPLSILFNQPTIEQLAQILKDEGWTPPWKSLVAVKPGGSKLPFYCIPPAGGTALHFKGMEKYLHKDQPFYVLESIGYDGKEPPHTKLEDMAKHYVKEIQTLQPEGPYLLGGRCFGGRVAFEVAQQFIKLEQKVALLTIFDTWPPFMTTPQSKVDEKRDIKYFIVKSFEHLRSGTFFNVAWNYWSNELRKFIWHAKNRIEYLFANKKKKLYKQIMAIHFKAQDTYIAKKYPGKITLIESGGFKEEYRERWKTLSEGGFECHTIEGTNHKTIVKEPHLKIFVEKLNDVLNKAHSEIDNNLKSNGAVNVTVRKEFEQV